MQVCWCADPWCKVNGCRLAKGYYSSGKATWVDSTTKDSVGNSVHSVFDWFAKEETVKDEPLQEFAGELLDATLTPEEEAVLGVVAYLLSKGVTVEELIKRLLTDTI